MKNKVFAFACVSLSFFWSVSTGRWGAQLPREPFFLNDLLLILGLPLFFLKEPNKHREFNLPAIATVKLLIFYTLLRAITSDWTNPFLTLRDLAPYGYLVIVILSYYGFLQIREQSLQTFLRITMLAILFRISWVFVLLLFSDISNFLPYVNRETQVKLFNIRGDSDSIFAATYCSYMIKNIFDNKRFKLRNILGIIVSISVIVLVNKRAGFLSLFLAVALSFLFTRNKNGQLRAFAALASVLILFSIMLVLPSTQGFLARSLSGIFESESIESQAALATSAARLNSWRAVTSYVANESERVVFGSGFGVDYMRESGATVALINQDAETRSLNRNPHNFLLNTYARLGFVGLILFICILWVTFSTILRYSRIVVSDDLLFVMLIIFVSSLTSSLVGVIVESPFGAIPFYFSIGCITALINRRRTHTL